MASAPSDELKPGDLVSVHDKIAEVLEVNKENNLVYIKKIGVYHKTQITEIAPIPENFQKLVPAGQPQIFDKTTSNGQSDPYYEKDDIIKFPRPIINTTFRFHNGDLLKNNTTNSIGVFLTKDATAQMFTIEGKWELLEPFHSIELITYNSICEDINGNRIVTFDKVIFVDGDIAIGFAIVTYNDLVFCEIGDCVIWQRPKLLYNLSKREYGPKIGKVVNASDMKVGEIMFIAPNGDVCADFSQDKLNPAIVKLLQQDCGYKWRFCEDPDGKQIPYDEKMFKSKQKQENQNQTQNIPPNQNNQPIKSSGLDFSLPKRANTPNQNNFTYNDQNTQQSRPQQVYMSPPPRSSYQPPPPSNYITQRSTSPFQDDRYSRYPPPLSAYPTSPPPRINDRFPRNDYYDDYRRYDRRPDDYDRRHDDYDRRYDEYDRRDKYYDDNDRRYDDYDRHDRYYDDYDRYERHHDDYERYSRRDHSYDYDRPHYEPHRSSNLKSYDSNYDEGQMRESYHEERREPSFAYDRRTPAKEPSKLPESKPASTSLTSINFALPEKSQAKKVDMSIFQELQPWATENDVTNRLPLYKDMCIKIPFMGIYGFITKVENNVVSYQQLDTNFANPRTKKMPDILSTQVEVVYPEVGNQAMTLINGNVVNGKVEKISGNKVTLKIKFKKYMKAIGKTVDPKVKQKFYVIDVPKDNVFRIYAFDD